MFSSVAQDIRITRRFTLIAVTEGPIGKDYPPVSHRYLFFDYDYDHRGILIRIKNLFCENAVCAEATKIISPLYYG